MLNSIESDFGNISCSELEETRLNSFVRYRTGNDNDGRKHKKIALDECQEMMNWLTKKLPSSTDQEQWTGHTNNLMFARQCMHYESQKCKRSYATCDDGNEDNIFQTTSSKYHMRTVEPRCNLEKIRMCEFIILFCSDNAFKGKITHEKDGQELESKITTELERNSANDDNNNSNSSDALDDCITTVFSSLDSGEIETTPTEEETSTNEYNSTPDEQEDSSTR